MRLSKFSLCNRLSVTALAALFALDSDSTADLSLSHADGWSLLALVTVLEISADEVRTGFGGGSRSSTVSQQLRYCPACLQLGFHAAWFQSLHVEHCPLHRRQLMTGCGQCASAVPYAIGQDLASHPLRCSVCGCAWVPALNRPAGRCLPLDRRSARLLGRWGTYVGHLTAHECLLPRQRESGRFVAATAPSSAARPHPITMVNRLFDAPPPLTAQLLTRRPQQRYLPSRPTTPVERPATGYDPANWPHFGRRFAQYEAVLTEVRSSLFGSVRDDCETGRWRHLLATDLVASCTSMDGETAVALGWSIGWMSPVQALATSPESSMPALGLAAWLAGLPLRPPQMSRQRWHAQVLQWLDEDLELSAWIWARVAAFMRAKGHYVLHGAMGHPRELARWRFSEKENGGIFTSNTTQAIVSKRIA